MSLKRLAPIVVIALAIVALTAHPASAADYFNPTDLVKDLVQKFYPTAQAWAFRLYSLLLIFELFALAVTAILFRNNIGEFIAGVALKVVLGSVFLYFVANGQTFFQEVVNGFSSAGMKAGQSNAGTPLELAATGIVAGGSFFYAAEKAHDADALNLNTNLLLDNCYVNLAGFTCPFGQVLAAAKGNTTFEYIADGIGMTLIVTFCAIQLQLVVITIESYIVMFAGVFFIGFAGSRFTMPFSQGYFNYMISVGVKLFTTYLIAGVVSALIVPILASALAALVLVGAVPDGVGANAALAPAAVATFESMMAAALIWAIPNYASAFLSGQSSASASSLLTQVASSLGTMKTLASQAAHHGNSGQKGGHAGSNAPGGNAGNVSYPSQVSYDTAPPGTQTTDVFAGTGIGWGGGGVLPAGGGFGDPLRGGGSGSMPANGAGGPRPSQGNGMQSNGATANALAMTGLAPEPKLRLSNPDPRAEG